MSIRKKCNIRINIFICLISVLLFVTLFSMQLVSSVYAKYRTTANNSEGARVALFNITQEGEIFRTVEAYIAPNTSHSIELVITNKSEVAVEYNVTITNVTGNIRPLKFRLNAQGTAPAARSVNGENGVSILSAQQIPGDHIDKYMLEIYWDPSASQEEDLALIGMVDYITIAVMVTQVD